MTNQRPQVIFDQSEAMMSVGPEEACPTLNWADGPQSGGQWGASKSQLEAGIQVTRSLSTNQRPWGPLGNQRLKVMQNQHRHDSGSLVAMHLL